MKSKGQRGTIVFSGYSPFEGIFGNNGDAGSSDMLGIPANRPTLFINTLKVVLCVGGLSLAAAHWLASSDFDRGGIARLADGRDHDPVTTGSITPIKPGTRLDPCQMRP